jgi:hypothetical protein
MNYKLSLHSKEQLLKRNISYELVFLVLSQPNRIIQQDACLNVYQKIIEQDKKQYLYRVFINICKTPPLVVTAYRTSKIDKYENKI